MVAVTFLTSARGCSLSSTSSSSTSSSSSSLPPRSQSPLRAATMVSHLSPSFSIFDNRVILNEEEFQKKVLKNHEWIRIQEGIFANDEERKKYGYLAEKDKEEWNPKTDVKLPYNGKFEGSNLPEKAKGVHGYSEDKGEYAYACTKGNREKMEDLHLVDSFEVQKQEVKIYALFDGHGGIEAVEYLRKNFTAAFKKNLEDRGLSHVGLWNASKLVFVELLRAFITSTKGEGLGGSTAVVVVKIGNYLLPLNVGDSRACLIEEDTGKTTLLTWDQKPTHPKIQRGIVKRKGNIDQGRIEGILAVGRAFGDIPICRYMTTRPSLGPITLEKGKKYRMAIVCDGVTDVGSSKQITKALYAVSQSSLQSQAEHIVNIAYGSGSEDNISVLLVKLSG